MPDLRARNLFFIDSRTTAATVAYSTAEKDGVPAASRKVFLDDTPTQEAVLVQLELAAKDASREGSAIAIRPPRTEGHHRSAGAGSAGARIPRHPPRLCLGPRAISTNALQRNGASAVSSRQRSSDTGILALCCLGVISNAAGSGRLREGGVLCAGRRE